MSIKDVRARVANSCCPDFDMVDWQDDRTKGSLSTHCHTLITNLAAISDLLYRHGLWLKSHEKNMNQNPYLYLAIY